LTESGAYPAELGNAIVGAWKDHGPGVAVFPKSKAESKAKAKAESNAKAKAKAGTGV
jgi:hypothetical protein